MMDISTCFSIFLRLSLSTCPRYSIWHRVQLLLLLLLSCCSRVRLCATPETAAHQAPPSLGFSRQEHWSGLPFPSPMHESEKWKWSLSVVSTLSDPMDCSLPGSSVHGSFQSRVLEWVAIAFSRESSWPRDRTHISSVSCISRLILYHSTMWETIILCTSSLLFINLTDA